MAKRKYHVQINYKSGQNVQFWCDDFKYEMNTIKRSASWDNAYPRPFWLNVDDIESIWHLNPEEGGRV